MVSKRFYYKMKDPNVAIPVVNHRKLSKRANGKARSIPRWMFAANSGVVEVGCETI